jgi:translocation and assembly module TamA
LKWYENLKRPVSHLSGLSKLRQECFLLLPLPLLVFIILLVMPATSSAADPLEIVITGVKGELLENVKAALALQPGLVQNGKVDELWAERFERQAPERVRAAVEPFGYYNPKISTSLENTGEGTYRLSVDVDAGTPVYLANVEVSVNGPGVDEKSLRSLESSFPLSKGDVLRQDKYEEAKGALIARAVGLGYLDASYPAHEILVDRQKSQASIRLTLETGPRYRFGDIRFEGAPQYPDTFLRRFLTFKSGQVFSLEKMGETQLNLMNSERFSDVVVSPEKEKAVGLEVPVVVRLTPAPSRHLRIGAGYGTDTGPRVSFDYRNLNFLKRGRELKASLNISSRIQGFGAAYIVPSAGSIDSYNEVLLDLKRERVTTYKNKTISLEGNRTRSFGHGRIGAVYLKLQREDFTIGSDRSRALLVMPGVRFSARRYDSLVRPTRGYRYAIDLKGTHRAIGSSTSFVQVEADGDAVLPLPWRLSLMSRFKAGLTLQSESLRELPASIRFFAGGDRSVRGYGYQTLGPKDATGTVIGGKNILVASVELDRAILSDWGVAVFFDIGNAFDSFTDVTLFKGAGVGVRYYTKIGAIRLDLARQVDVKNPRFRVHITVGFEQ